LFSNQELAIAYALGFEQILVINQKSILPEGICVRILLMSDWGGENLKEDVRWKYGVPQPATPTLLGTAHGSSSCARRDCRFRLGKRFHVV